MGPHGETLLEYTVWDALHVGFGRLVLVIRPETRDLFCEGAGGRCARHLPVSYAYQETDPASLPGRPRPGGTGQALLCAAGQISGCFAMCNADDWYGRDALRTAADYLRAAPQGGESALVSFPLRETLSPSGPVSRAICRTDGAGFLRNLEELLSVSATSRGIRARFSNGGEAVLTGDEPVSMNLWAFTPPMLPLLEETQREFRLGREEGEFQEFGLPQAIGRLVEEEKVRVRVLRSGSSWFGVTWPDDRDHVRKEIMRLTTGGRYPEPLWDRT